jgi:DNA-binding PadR family transcriptional regulator
MVSGNLTSGPGRDAATYHIARSLIPSLDLTQWNVNTADPSRNKAAPLTTRLGDAMMGERPLNATAASLLGFLHDGPLTGWDLVVAAQLVIGDFWSLTQSQVYRELATMAAAGLVEAGEVGRRDRKPYAITPSGRTAFAAWLDREPGPETIRFPLLLTVAFGRHLPKEKLTEFLTTHRKVHAQRLAGYQEQIANAELAATDELDPYLLATLKFGLTYERAVLDWFDQLPPTISNTPRPSRTRLGVRAARKRSES